jgi:hypothetical protein
VASVAIYFKNGDVLGVGAAADQAVAIYRGLTSEVENDFLDLGALGDGFPRIAIRIADVQSILLNPMDVETVYYHTSAIRHARLVAELQSGLRAAAAPGEDTPKTSG